ncbi:hypothetical protein B0T36_15250 [Nocardia donostiensis]|uniref:type II secretion system F family protein n=1 Tax=Nocardia donostiensis TaxID=1538463 RepID=UPI0009D975D5|nr:hypothetical protein [Nocardia donostiensis]OQS14349.1 hypothetical protein B0T36_15250 [Nocardia donostiensis]
MSPALVCAALALLAVPRGRQRRRFSELFATVCRPAARYGSAAVYRVGAGIGCAAAFLLGIGPLIAAVILAGTIGIRMRRAARDRSRRTECGQLLDALDAVIGELRVGAHPSAAAQVAAAEAAGVASRAFAVSSARSRLGGCGSDALRGHGWVIGAELGRIADAWRVAENHGLALAELLGAARTDLTARIRFRDRTEAALAGARATAAVLAGLPLLGIALGQLMGAAPLGVLFTSPAGNYLLPIGAGLACAGLLWSDAITRKVLI